MTAIPLIDLNRWFNGSISDRAALAREVDATLRRCGFLVVVNHQIEPSVMNECRSAARRFFHLDSEVKQQTALGPDAYRGWVAPGLESNAATYGVDTPPDVKETFAYGPVDVPDQSLRLSQHQWYAENRWPSDLPALQPAAEAWWRAARGLADTLLEIFAVALELEPDHLINACDATTASVSLNWYWPRSHLEPEDGQFRIGPHTDFGTLTILDREPGVGGLQIQDEHGAWIDAPVIDGGLIVNTGDLLRQWTNDRWCSNIHRVLPPPKSEPDEELVSLVFFHEPNHDTVIDPFGSCVSADRPPLYAPVLASDYLSEKMEALSVA